MPKRYKVYADGFYSIDESDDGIFVKYDDYEKLLKDLEKSEEEVHNWKFRLNVAQEVIDAKELYNARLEKQLESQLVQVCKSCRSDAVIKLLELDNHCVACGRIVK